MKNTHRQLSRSTTAAINGGAIVAPRPDPALKIPKANDLSFAENHSEIAFAAAGKAPPSPSPSKKSPTPKPHTPQTAPYIRWAADHHTKMAKDPQRPPNASLSLPPNIYITPHART